ncbi:MAG: hypothetical protein OJF59_002528 [Cytophagales bacterium]|jgi:hypothetical protein|nr:hypothetical protein [Bacteroidota bacterium]MBS1980251.1 hypothetical protein [Bacteroidota bacterium]WHZ08774.1 MAG: hypothetical protein OJF59_002528 [Cytophagales bacterium]
MNYNQIQISNSPVNGKARIIDVNGIVIRPDLESITVITIRKFYDVTVSGNATGYTELSGVEFTPFEFNVVADNTRHCNSENGYRCYPTSGGTYVDVAGNTVVNPIGFYDFFQPMLSQPVSIMTIVKNNLTLEDQLYKSWD